MSATQALVDLIRHAKTLDRDGMVKVLRSREMRVALEMAQAEASAQEGKQRMDAPTSSLITSPGRLPGTTKYLNAGKHAVYLGTKDKQAAFRLNPGESVEIVVSGLKSLYAWTEEKKPLTARGKDER